jgi:hypothetical protein
VFICLELLAYKGIINIDYDALQQWGSEMIGQVGALEGVMTLIIANLPFAASFLVASPSASRWAESGAEEPLEEERHIFKYLPIISIASHGDPGFRGVD